MPNNRTHLHVDRTLVRTAVVLGHTVTGAELLLTTPTGQALTVGRAEHHDLTPCDLRQALLVAAHPSGPDCYRYVRSIDVVGSLADLDGGLYGTTAADGGPERWFATALEPDLIESIVEDCDLDLPDEAIVAGVVTDGPLGASAVRLTASDPAFADRLDEVARWFLGRCLVEELLASARTTIEAEKRG